jgi:hypothetical protein
MANKKHNKNVISGFWGNDPLKSPEMMMRESFLRMAKESLDSFGVETYSIENIRGGLLMLEKFKEINEE